MDVDIDVEVGVEVVACGVVSGMRLKKKSQESILSLLYFVLYCVSLFMHACHFTSSSA